MADELIELAKARAELSAIGAQRAEQQAALERSRSELKMLVREGARRAPQATIERAISKLESAQRKVIDRERDVIDRIEELRDRIRLRTPETSVEQLNGQVPVAMLPVRLETRFTNGGTELRIRVYPEQLHIDAHEPGLTDGELAVATTYWSARWAASNADDHSAAWRELLRVVRPARARFLVVETEPTNLAQMGTGTPKLPDVALRAGAFTHQPTARLLPEQWVAIGYRGGTEVARAWGAPVREGLAVGLPPDLDDDGVEQATPDVQDDLAIDDSIRWLVDFDEAAKVGMAVTIRQADVASGQVADGFDELVVLGVDWGADPAAASASIDEQLRRHAFTDGLSLLGPGVPTNNTDEERAAAGTDPYLDGVSFDPSAVVTDPGAVGSLATALGVDPAVGLAGAPVSGSLGDVAAGDMNNVLWASTLGGFLDQMMEPVVPSTVVDDVHDHFTRFVRGQGPYATLRVGKQPYGVLPVVAGTVSSDDDFVDDLATRLNGLRPFWEQAADSVPRLGESNRPDVDAMELLRRTPRSATYRFREAFAGSVSTSILGFDLAAVLQEMVANLTLALAGIPGRPRIAGITLDPAQRDVPVPLVTYGALSETEPLDPDYIHAVLAATNTAGGFRQLLSKPGAARTLLEALLRHAAASEYVIGSTLLVLDFELSQQVITKLPDSARFVDREIIGIAADTIATPIDRPGPDAPTSLLASVGSSVELAETTIREVTGSRTLVNHLAVTPNAELARRVVTRRFARFRASLGRLEGLPTAELDRLASSTLDCVAHRLDAWVTSVATRRLDTVRTERGSGTYIGGFGYVEDLRPSTAPVSRGYLHAPSISHAATAAILRSGHLARGESPEGTFAVDLGSRRVAGALDLLDGMRRSQPIGALLGYRFERSVRDASLQLAKYILPIRQRTPLAHVDTGPDPTASVESIAARDVVDGVALLDAWRPDPGAFWTSLRIPVASADRAQLDGLMRRLDDAFDAVADVLVAESVHQAVLGNTERSAATLDALDRQQPLPDVSVVRTPRNAVGLAHRLLVLFDSDAPAPGWSTADPRRAADQRVDSWCGAVLGDPSRYRFAAEVRDGEGVVVETVQARLTDLGLSAISTIAACAAAGTDASELEQRVAVHLGGLVTDARAAEIALLDDAPAGSGTTALGLRDLLDLGGQVGNLLSSARQADARALLPDTERADAGIDLVDLRARADAAVAALATAVGGLEALIATSPVDAVVDALLAAADAGLPSSVPAGEPPHDHATRIAEMGRRSLDALDARESTFDRTAADAAGIAAHDLARIRAVFGEGFPAFVRFTLPPPAPDTEDFRASLAASNSDVALLGDDLEAPSWLAMHAPVRPAVARLTDVLEAAEMLGGRVGLADVHVAQLPHRPGAAWIGRPFESAPPPTTSWVVHASTRPVFDGPLTGIIVDQWTEAIPSTTETTGVSFHFDAPGARAPQTILMATPASTAATSWSVSTLAATVREAMALARIRALDIDDIDAAARFVPAVYLPFNIEARTPSIDLFAIINAAVAVKNEMFLKAEA